jgi:hypothetical protein
VAQPLAYTTRSRDRARRTRTGGRRVACGAPLALVAACGLAAAARAQEGAEAAAAGAVVWRRIAELPRADGATALAVDPGSGRVAVGDAAGVLLVGRDGSVARVMRRRAVLDLAFLPGGDLLVATDAELERIDTAGRRRRVAPAAGAAARPLRIAAADGAIALATGDGAFVSHDGERWEAVPGLPRGEVTAVALRAAPGGLVCFALARGELHAAALAREAGRLVSRRAVREEVSIAFREEPVDVVPGLAGADLAILYPTALALREAPGSPWRLVQAGLPPGALAHRVVSALGRLWLATDRGLLEAASPEGPWQRAAGPAGSSGVAGIAAGVGTLHAVAGAALLVAAPARPQAPRAIVAELPEDPAIERVHRAALDFLDLGPGRVAGMWRGVGLRGWLPRLGVGGTLARDRGFGVGRDESFVSGATRQLVDRDEERSDDNEVSLVLTWELADLAYHPEEIDISHEARELIELRDDVLDEITQLYFERRRVLLELAAAPGGDEAARLRLRAAELAAGIDAWTGGWFTQALRQDVH